MSEWALSKEAMSFSRLPDYLVPLALSRVLVLRESENIPGRLLRG